jgi:hypothetical protein
MVCQKSNAYEVLKMPFLKSNTDEVLTLRKKLCNKPMTYLMLMKNLSDEAFNDSSPRFIASSCQHYMSPC